MTFYFRINTVSPVERTPQEVMIKWGNIRTQTLSKFDKLKANRNKTGNFFILL